jgi:PIN domain nuclease of toxin-antitoxin system
LTAAVLVDTPVLLWVRIAPERLSGRERRALDTARWRYVSAVTLWEIAILMSLDRVARDQRLFDIPDGFDLLPIRPEHCAALITLPKLHRDPFDRMLIAQARAEDMPLLTRDKNITDYGIASVDGDPPSAL